MRSNMTADLRITLLGDGSSDRCLLMHILWIIEKNLASETIVEHTFVSTPRERGGRGLKSRIQASLREAPCDILFVHRDAERDSLEIRTTEIQLALCDIEKNSVPIVPVRMTEAWLLF